MRFPSRTILLPFLLLAAAAGPAWPQHQQDARNIGTPPNTNTHFKMPEYKTLAQWEARKQELKEKILFWAGLDPMPERPPVRSEVFGRLENKDYSIEKVLVETRHGYWLGGNLYRPLGRTGKFPAIVSPHGHWSYGRLEHTPTGSIPTRGINLARQGYVVFMYDMVGYNDTRQTPHDFGNKTEQLWNWGPLGLQLWNSIRAVDFLTTLPDVDTARIGATGASGGGTQTFLLAAVDERIKYAVPVNMISAIMQGGSPCENAPGLRVGAFNVEFGALMAPRPMLMVSATGDWTRNTLEEEYPAVKGIYELYDRASLVEAVRIDAPHNYNKDSREAMYKFFAKHALGDTDTAKYAEKNARIEPLPAMLALHGRTLPVGALNYEGLFIQWRTIAMQQLDRLSGNLEEKRRLLRLALNAEWPREVASTSNGETVAITRTAVKDRIPGVWLAGTGQTALVVHPEGAAAARASDDVAALIAAKRPVLMIDAFQTGQAKAPHQTDTPHLPHLQPHRRSAARAGHPHRAPLARIQGPHRCRTHRTRQLERLGSFRRGHCAHQSHAQRQAGFLQRRRHRIRELLLRSRHPARGWMEDGDGADGRLEVQQLIAYTERMRQSILWFGVVALSSTTLAMAQEQSSDQLFSGDAFKRFRLHQAQAGQPKPVFVARMDQEQTCSTRIKRMAIAPSGDAAMVLPFQPKEVRRKFPMPDASVPAPSAQPNEAPCPRLLCPQQILHPHFLSLACYQHQLARTGSANL